MGRGYPDSAVQPQSKARSLPTISVILPIREEAAQLPASLGSVLAQDYPAELLEILVVDGQSQDGSAELSVSLASEHAAKRPDSPAPALRVIENPRLSSAAAMNLGLEQARGELVARVDGHAWIAPNYLRTAEAALRASGADCVGGPLETRGNGKTGEAIALAMASPLGVGASAFRTGSTVERDVDTVAFGLYRGERLRSLGRFDESFERNADDELHLRLTSQSGRIRFIPSLYAGYECRDSFSGLARQYYGYGYWKLKVLTKHGHMPSLRAWAPPLLILYLSLGTLLVGLTAGLPWTLVPIATYIFGLMLAALWIGKKQLALVPRISLALGTLHLSYGIGFFMGIQSALKNSERVSQADKNASAL